MRILAGLMLGVAAMAGAQLPSLPVPSVPQLPLPDVTDRAVDAVGSVASLARERIDRLADLVRDNSRDLTMTREGPAVRGAIVAIDPDAAAMAAANRLGLDIVRDERIEGLDLRTVTFAAPRDEALDRLIARLRKASPNGTFTANHLYFTSGSGRVTAAAAAATGGVGTGAIGVIDGGVASHSGLDGRVQQKGFAAGGVVPTAHGTAVASLAAGGPPLRTPAPGAPLLVADVYGADKTGGNALYIARALGWMTAAGASVVTMSLAGPPNALLERAIRSVRARGVWVVAAVGNDGPSAPPAYPASYSDVIAVTGVDGRNRALIEAGRALHLDFAAPGADVLAPDARGRMVAVRGTSYATPLVAGLVWRTLARGARDPIHALASGATDLGKRGPDRLYGHGLICADCRVPAKK